MKTHNYLLIAPFLFCTLSACSPADSSSETVLDTQRQALNKAKGVEQIGLDHKKNIDDLIKEAE